jgi:hypothetical protein
MTIAEEAVGVETPTVPDTPEVSDVDLHVLVAEIIATNERAAEAEAVLEAEKAAVRTWYRTFVKDSWEYADAAQHCPTWEACAREAGIPGRPGNRDVSVRGEVITPFTIGMIVRKMGVSEAMAAAMYSGLPEDQRVTTTSHTWNLTVTRKDIIPADWDPLDKKSFKAGCICPAGREAFIAYAHRNYGADVTLANIEVRSGCAATTHIPQEEK